MVYLYLCKACEDGDHGKCDLCHPAPKGNFGGRLCRCPCHGNPRWNTPEFIEEELQNLVDKMIDHQKASEEVMKNNPIEVSRPSQKIQLKP